MDLLIIFILDRIVLVLLFKNTFFERKEKLYLSSILLKVLYIFLRIRISTDVSAEEGAVLIKASPQFSMIKYSTKSSRINYAEGY